MISLSSYATHNRAGEIVYKRIEGQKYEITIITYTEINNDNADRPELGINYGDGTGIDSIKRTKKIPGFIDANIQLNEYKTTHTYPGYGKYTISMLDPNRNGDVINIPNSIDEMFYIESVINTNVDECSKVYQLTHLHKRLENRCYNRTGVNSYHLSCWSLYETSKINLSHFF